MTSRWPTWGRDPIVLLLALATVLVGTLSGLAGDSQDIDERVYRSTILQMQQGKGYYEAVIDAVTEKEGRPPSQVRSVRPPVLAQLLALFPERSWRWLATIPALALCAAAGALAGPTQRSRRIAVGLTGLWMIVSLPLLYLHHELWGAPLVAFAAVAHRRDRAGLAAGLSLAATLLRELFGLSLLVGLVLARDRRPWLVATAGALAGAALHVHLARQVLDPNGFDPPLEALDPYLAYVSPGSGAVSSVLGAAMLLAAAYGAWTHRHRRDLQFALLATGPLLVAGALAGRSYWALTWIATASAAAALAVEKAPSLARP